MVVEVHASGQRYGVVSRIARQLGKESDAYIGPLGKRVPFAMHAQNALHYWPLND